MQYTGDLSDQRISEAAAHSSVVFNGILLHLARAHRQYVLSSPAMLVSEDMAKVCINIVGSTEALDVSVSLEHNGKNISIIAQDVEPPKYFQCSDIKVPSVSKAVPVAIIFTATGPNTDLRERKAVVINTASDNCMFQMDKPIYKPGQKVSSRLICLNSQLKPVTKKLTSMYLQDPSRTKIAQWLNPESNHGVVSVDFQLISDAPPGSYVLSAEGEFQYPISQYFTVEQYVLPRFKVNLDYPRTVSVLEESINVNISAIYTYGEPMSGSVTARYCKQPQYYGRRQNCFNEKSGFCANMTGELGPDGTYSGVIDLYSSFMRSVRGGSFTMDVTVTETGTGIQVTETGYMYITSQPARLSFDYDYSEQYYKRGLKYVVAAKLTDEKDQPIPNQELEVQVDDGEPEKAITDSEGRIEHRIDTMNMIKPNFTLRVSYKNPDQCYFSEWSEQDYPMAEKTVYRFYSYSGSFLQIKKPKGELSCGQSHSIEVSYIISPEGIGAGVNKATFYYLVLSRSEIVQSGQKDVDLSSTMNDSFSFDLAVSSDLAPNADMIVYSILEKEMITDTVDLNIEKCFKNQVSMTFSEEKVTPGSSVDVQLSASPNSHCALRVIDSSLLILNPYEQFSADGVYSSLRYYYYGYNVAGFDVEDPAPPCEDPDKLVFYKGRYYLPVSSKSEGDSYNNIKSVGLVVGTSARLRKPEVCQNNPPSPPVALESLKLGGGGGGFGSPLADRSSAAAAPVETVRTNFAETFLWVMIPLDTEGHATLSEDIPDTITSWQGMSFCISEETGFGMTRNPANITTFQPFFIELSTPYSCIRGETLVLIGVVHNYLEQCVKVSVTMENSNAYTAVLKEGEQNACVCANGKAAYTWEVQTTTIGEISFTVSAQTTHIGQSCDGANDKSQPPRKDTVVQTMIVDPEGIYQELTSSNLVFVQNNNLQLPVSITLPVAVVPDSAKPYVTAVADIFALPLRSLQNLLQKPYGCAEQNLVRVAPIPYVVAYLNVTGQLTEEILQQAKNYMSEGYYRQLSFTSGGAYRAFANSIEPVNSWLTAYTFKTLENIKNYVYVDENRQQQTLIWLENSQKLENGCFSAQGNLFTMQNTDSDLHFTAYLAISLLESEYSLGATLLNGAMECLKNASKSEQKIADQVLMLYAFSLANLPEYREPLLQSLMKKAITEGGTIHWENDETPKNPRPVPFFLPPSSSANVEITSYMLLSMAAVPNVSKEDLTKMAQTGMWLARNQNSNGGFRSTQDTVVALQAMAALAKLLYVPDSHQTVVVRRGNGEVTTFNLNKDNRLVVQRQPLPDASGEYVIDVSGSGWCMIQTTVGYNIPVPKENSDFSLSISSSSENCLNGVAYTYTVNIAVSYGGSRNESGMAIINVRLLTGYTAEYSSLRKLMDDKIISKYEETLKGEVILYLETVTSEPINLSFRALVGQRVLNVKSSSAVVYSYYEPEENGYGSYRHPCADIKV
ncbi:ovostatin-like [Hyla sarda]|uniref:ovostatin-like n=1 Tax=Hyla sarda TaxID=327740 RepID=UPI0024C2F2E5|nr:ovostatin-like [Hyla sarda]